MSNLYPKLIAQLMDYPGWLPIFYVDEGFAFVPTNEEPNALRVEIQVTTESLIYCTRENLDSVWSPVCYEGEVSASCDDLNTVIALIANENMDMKDIHPALHRFFEGTSTCDIHGGVVSDSEILLSITTPEDGSIEVCRPCMKELSNLVAVKVNLNV